MDAVYLVGPLRQRGEPLRYSIRSVVANMSQVDRVVTVGHRWPWLSDEVLHVDVPQERAKHENTWRNLRAVAAHPDVSDEFLLMNDDFFVMEPISKMPVLHRGDFATWATEPSSRSLLERRRQAAEMLDRLGVEDPLCYELHVPMPVNRRMLADSLARVEEIRVDYSEPPIKRSLYGNLAGIGGQRAADVKARGRRDAPAVGPLLSTSPQSWAGRAGDVVRAAFTHPSRYES